MDGQLSFPPGLDRPDGFYRTVFGPSVSTNARIYARTDHNLRLAFRRLTSVREPDRPGFHATLFKNQEKFLKNEKTKKFLKNVSQTFVSYFDSYSGAYQEALDHHADPHPKRDLRIQGMTNLLDQNIAGDHTSRWVNRLEVKIKPEEWAKDDKYGRVVGDFGVEASLLGFRLTDILKVAQNLEPVYVNGGEIHFCKTPAASALSLHFAHLLDPPGRFYFVYFSDDSCLAIRRPDGRVDRYNLDISTCDASHGPHMFRAYVKLFPKGLAREDALRLVRQCELPIRIHSMVDRRRFVDLRCKRPLLYSGSTITTSLNDLACTLIAYSISCIEYTGALDANGVSQEIVNAAANVGYVLTGCEPLAEFEDVQFLKNSPVLGDDGKWHPMLNFGVLLRASGVCRGDLPGRGDLRARAEAFQRGLLQGCYPRTDFEVVDAMKQAVGSGPVCESPEITTLLAYKVGDQDLDRYRVDPESFCRRYRLTSLEYTELLCDFATSGYGFAYNGSSVDKILFKDYGLHTVEHSDTEYLCVQQRDGQGEILT